MTPIDLQILLDKAVASRGADDVAEALERLAGTEPPAVASLTVVANAGIHVIPQRYMRGEVYIASQGNWDDSSEEALVSELESILWRLAQVLKSRQWQRVYLIPTGHPVLSLQIKALVYRVLRLNSIDLYHNAGKYLEIDIDQRAVALRTTSQGQ